MQLREKLNAESWSDSGIRIPTKCQAFLKSVWIPPSILLVLEMLMCFKVPDPKYRCLFFHHCKREIACHGRQSERDVYSQSEQKQMPSLEKTQSWGRPTFETEPPSNRHSNNICKLWKHFLLSSLALFCQGFFHLPANSPLNYTSSNYNKRARIVGQVCFPPEIVY